MTAPEQGSFSRAVFGAVFLVASLVGITIGFIRLVAGLRGAGYGSPEVQVALGWLGVSGGLLAIGICLLIWEVSIRYGIRK
jgi:hypothetical protein